jgi:hypothetical protein
VPTEQTNRAYVEVQQPRPEPARRTPIPNDRTLTIAKVHPAAAEEAAKTQSVSLLQWVDVDDIFDACGPLELCHTIKDPMALLGAPPAEWDARHDISTIQHFACLSTLTRTLRQGESLDELQRRPLLLTASRAVWMDDFVRRLHDHAFATMLEQDHAKYRQHISRAMSYISQVPSAGPPPDPEEIKLVAGYLPGIPHSLTPGTAALELGSASRLLTNDTSANLNRALQMPVVVKGSQPAPVERRHFVLDRLRFEEIALAFYKGGPIGPFQAEMQSKSKDFQAAVQLELRSAFAKQLPFQTKFYALEEIRAQAERQRKRDKPFLTANLSVEELLEERGARAIRLAKKFPGPKALNFDEAIALITVLEDGLHPQVIEQLSRLAYDLRARLVLPMYAKQELEEIAELVEPGAPYANLYGIQQDGEQWKRIVYPVGGAFHAFDPHNPFIDYVPLPMASVILGRMLDISDKPALPPAGNNNPLQLRGVLKSGEPSWHIINGDDLDGLRGTANAVVCRTGQVYEVWGVNTYSQEDGFDQVNLVGCHQDLERNVSELLLQRMYMPDGDPQRQALAQKIDDYILANSDEKDDTKMFAGGRTVEIREAVDEKTRKRIPGVVHILLDIRFKRVIVGFQLEIRQLPVVLTAQKNGEQGWSLI